MNIRNHTIHLDYEKNYCHLKAKDMNLTDDRAMLYIHNHKQVNLT